MVVELGVIHLVHVASQIWTQGDAKEVHLRTAVAVAPHPHTVAPARRKPKQGNAPSLTRAVAWEHTKLSHPIADT